MSPGLKDRATTSGNHCKARTKRIGIGQDNSLSLGLKERATIKRVGIEQDTSESVPGTIIQTSIKYQHHTHHLHAVALCLTSIVTKLQSSS